MAGIFQNTNKIWGGKWETKNIAYISHTHTHTHKIIKKS